MARVRKPEPEPEPTYYRHTAMPQLGPCVVVHEVGNQITYLFADGKQRMFRDAWVHFVEEHSPTEEDRAKLWRGKAGGGGSTPKALHLELEAQLRAKPREVEPYLVYADWLQSKSDPRGPLIVLQHQLRDAPDDKKLRAAEKKMLDVHGDYLLPDLLAPLLPTRAVKDPGMRSEARWHMGYLERVRIARKTVRDDDHPMPEIVAGVLDHPSSQFLRSLVLGPIGAKGKSKYADSIDAIGRRERPLLEELVIGDVGALDIPYITTGNLAPIVHALPGLRRLEVRTATLRLDSALVHAALRELVVVTTSLSVATLRRLATAKLPELSRLELHCPTVELDLGAIKTFGEGMPKLRTLSIRARNAVAVADAIRRLPLASQLDVADPAPASKPPLAAAPPITMTEVAELAPDRASVQAARLVGRPSAWRSIGRDDQRVWGQYQGRGLYFVSTRFDGSRASCNCGSFKDPCKHVLGLLLIVASGHPIEHRSVPTSVREKIPDLSPA